jgi:hypothetical protein
MYPNLHRFLYCLLIIIFGPIGLVLATVLGIVGLILALPAIGYGYCCGRRFERMGCGEKSFTVSWLIVVCIILTPLSLAILLIGAALGIIAMIFYGVYALIYCLRNI